MDPFSKLTNVKTLLVDDDAMICDAMSMAFRNRGCHLLAVETAEEGLQALQDDSFDIIISDFRLPGMDGLEFFKLTITSHPHAVHILVTAFGDEDLSTQGFGIGVHEFMQKPFSPKELAETVALRIENQGSNETLEQLDAANAPGGNGS